MAVKHLRIEQDGVVIVGFFCTEVGDQIPPHVHPHGHFFVVGIGAFDVWDGKDITNLGEFSGAWIDKEVPHALKATKAPSMGLCVQVMRDKDGKPFTHEEYSALDPFERHEAGRRLRL